MSEVLDLADIDLLNTEVFGRGAPHDWFAYLREHAPVFKHPEPYGPGFWVLTKHADISLVGRDPKTFSSSAELGGVDVLDEPPPEVAAQVERTAAAFEGNMLPLMDPPEHTLYRKIVHDAFRPKSIWTLEDRIRSGVVDVLERAIAKREIDFVHDVAADLTSRAIAELLGMPAEHRHLIFDWSSRISEHEHPDFEVRRRDAETAFGEALDYSRKLADDIRRSPRDDVLSIVLNAEVDGHTLSELDFANFLVLLAIAGEETTRITLSHAVIAFLEHPDQYEILRSDPSVIDTAVEEVIRWATPALYFRRTVTQDAEIRGVEIAAGDKVSIWYISANRDEDVFDDPFRFDVRRSPNDHIAFGHGHHFCLGVHLARLEIKVVLQEMARRIERFELIGDIERLKSNQIHGIKRLPVRVVEGR